MKTKKYSYVDLISVIEEVNRCPGGKRTINYIVQNSFLERGSRVLEIGSNTGFTSIEIAKLKDVEVIGIDVNENAVKKSNDILSREPKFIQDRVSFQVASALELPFPDNSFDLIITGGANSFIDASQREKALKEYKRVLKPYGMLSITNLYYDSAPTKKVLDDLYNVLGFEIKPYKKGYWQNLFLNNSFELFAYKETKLISRSKEIIQDYVDNITKDNITLNEMDQNEANNIKSEFLEAIQVFNENHKYLSFMSIILRNNFVEEQQELFLEEGTLDCWNINDENEEWEVIDHNEI
ncbi:methyltransferase domain-containing protein [Robertmurraya beringensis]|uniref:Methyltransferase domain-containing protein n=1 Tax=Robertmurraya beringensis TaxID=641660 RepID=A0ABV6KU43_9BACI